MRMGRYRMWLNSAEQRADAAIRVLVLGLLVGMMVSWRAWVPGARTFPLTPLWEDLAVEWGTFFGGVWLAGMVVSAFILLIWPEKRGGAWLLGLATVALVLEDVHRLQPWLFLYVLMLLAMGKWRANAVETGLTALRLVLSATWLFSG
ncbi:MAG: hypothetical protein AAF570_22610, partial [Bacteroidota bacterium]